jgi:predicted ArsR family transcriptional regulator
MRNGEPVGGASPEVPTRDRLLEEISRRGPIAASALAELLALTPAAVRRHLAALREDGLIAERDVPPSGGRTRGRPSREYVLSREAHDDFRSHYDRLAGLALEELERAGGREAVRAVARGRVAGWDDTLGPAVSAPESLADRVDRLADLLTEDGYAASVRSLSVPVPAPDGDHQPLRAVQLCQGHCPVQAVAARYPEFCEEETDAIGRLLGTPVQRLSTLARGAHVCTTHVTVMEGNTP